MTDQSADGAAVMAADIETTPALAAASLDGAADTAHKRRADDNGAASPRKKARKDQTEAEASDGVDEGEVNSDLESKMSASSQQAGRAWNSGITTQLRTSFGSSSKSSKLHAAKHSPRPTAAPEETSLLPGQLAPEVRGELVAAVKAGETTVLPAVKEHERTWELPTFKADFQGETWDDIFKSMFSQWSTDFISKNQENVDQAGLDHKFLGRICLETLEGCLPGINPTLITVSKNHLNRTSKRSLSRQVAKGWADSRKEGKRAKKEAKAQAKQKAEQEGKRLSEQPEQPPTRQTRSSSKKSEGQDSDTGRSANSSDRKSSSSSSGPSLPDNSLPPLSELATSQQPHSVAEDHVPMDERQNEGQHENDKDQKSNDMVPEESKVESKTLLLTEDELEQRHRYFPGVPDDAVFCLTCASHGHNTPDCPETICKFCQQGHFSYSCPSRQRCTKCKQLGHAKASCKEKLAMAAGEGFMECAFCQAQDHQEEQCPEIWETYRPQIGHIKQVRSVPIFCYCCGSEGHFGTDCGLADRKLPPSATWSNAGASLYVDPASSEEAIAFKNPLPEPKADSAPVIPGRSIKPQSHIIFEDSGDEEVGQGFLRAPATGPRRPGQIQITSNINFGGSAGPSAQNGGGAQQDSSQSSKRRKQRGANGPASLPPKPQTAAPAPQASKKGKNNKRNGKNSQQQQPPLPPGPPPGNKGWRPPEFQARGANSTRGRGGFSSLSRGGRRGGGRN